jgi:ATP-binding cassette, subfamily F, member 3
MLRLNAVRIDRGTRTLLRDVSVAAAPGERVGLVGANGCGKSSLLAAVLGRIEVDAGSIEAPPADRIASIEQEVEGGAEAAIDFVMKGHLPLARAREELRRAETQHDELALALAHAHLAEANEGAIAAQAMAVLHGLGFSPSDAQRPVRELSGGQRNRLALARVLLQPSDLLLLDEPTNHLDLDSIVWLEAWLKRQPATVIVVSHDREFLDRCVGAIWSIADQALRRFAGNYSAFELQWFEQRRHQEAQVRRQQRTVAHLTSFVERFRAKATKARQAQSRLKMLERLERLEPVRQAQEWRFEFLEPLRLPEHLVDADALTLAYGAVPVLSGVRFSIRAGDRIGVLGVNGAGKSTLVKAIVGELPAAAGEIRRQPGTAIGYFAQHQLDKLDTVHSPLEAMRAAAPDRPEQELRDFLGSYRFGNELVHAPVGRLSGGERARLALALLAWGRPNLLVMDEPSNHLDMDTREALTVALSSFEGALLVVSHDRHLLRAATDQLWLVHDHALSPFDGDLDDYADWVLEQRRSQARDERLAPAKRGDQRRQAAAERQRLAQARRPLQKQMDSIEQRVSQATAELRELDTRLADEAFYRADAEQVAGCLKRRAALQVDIESMEERWFALQAQLEELDAGAGAGD